MGAVLSGIGMDGGRGLKLMRDAGCVTMVQDPASATVPEAPAQALSAAVREGWLGQLAVQRADGEQALTSELADVLREAGFRATPSGLRLRA